MVLVLGIVMFMIVTTVAVRSVIGIQQTDRDRNHQEALQMADGALDRVLFQVLNYKVAHKDDDASALGYATQTPQSVAAEAPLVDDVAPADGADERAWAIETAQRKQASGTTTPITETAEPQYFPDLVPSNRGEWSVVKPKGQNVVYSVGFIPSRANPKTTRVLRIEFDFPPFNAVNAILTGGSIKIGGNANISGANGSIHANGDFSYNGSSWNVSQSITAGGEFQAPGATNVGDMSGSGGGKPKTEILDSITQVTLNHDRAIYEFCPDGSVWKGPMFRRTWENPNPTAPPPVEPHTPCVGPWTDDIANRLSAPGQTFRGWSPQIGKTGAETTWSYNDSACYNGVFYFHHGSVKITGNPGSEKDQLTCMGQPWKATILASAENRNGQPECRPNADNFGGDIEIQGNPKWAAYDGGILAQAGRDFIMKGTGQAVSVTGAITVREQFDLSGNMALTGNLIAADMCDTPGSPVNQTSVNLSGSSSIVFNDAAELPLGNLIRITRWNEL